MSLFLLGMACTAAGGTIYVDADAIGANNGSSWGDAFNDLQDALAFAQSGDEIRVAQGTYKPDQGAGITPGDREATFQLINGVAIKGGYAGFGEPDPNARDIELYETILSGDLLGNDGPDFANNWDNSYHVVTGNGTNDTAVLDGFTITAGNANGSEDNEGGGMCNSSSSPTVNNCVFSTNSATHGGGMYNWDNSNPTLTNCTFSKNSADRAGGMLNRRFSNPTLTNCTFTDNSATTLNGGGMDNLWVCSPTLTNCTFRGNSAAQYGGGLDNYLSSPTLTNCTFTDNSAQSGGGMENLSSSPTVTNCTFIGNSATHIFGAGGGMRNWASNPTVTNCTFSGNSANKGGGMYNFIGSPTVTNCILWGNSAEDGTQVAALEDSSIRFTYCDLEGGPTAIYVDASSIIDWGPGNITEDPCLVEPGYWDANGVWVDGDYHLVEYSPCIDVGDPDYIAEPNETDLDGRPRIIGGRIDMGAYEFQPPHILYVDDDAPNDPGPGDPGVSDPEENGTEQHPFDTIQEAMDVAGDGDTVIVLPGDYYENTDFMGKNFTLTSADPEDPTIRQATRIHAESGYAIIASDGNIFGLSISGNNGIRCFDIDYTSYSPTIRNCRIIVERIGIRFTLPYCHEAVHPVIENNIIAGNHHCIYMDAQAFASGGVEGVIRNNVFTSSGGDKIGCGITYRGCKSVPEVVNNIFVNLQYGIHIFYCCKFQERTARINYNNLYDNHQNYRVEAGSCPLDLTGVQGNISEDPLFVDFANGDFHLGPNSPCINAGDPNYIAEPNETDLDGLPRVIGGRIDMGAYEFNHIPVADAGPDQTAYSWIDGIAEVTLDGAASYDDDGQPLSYLWRWTVNGQTYTATGPGPTIELPVGEQTIKLIVNDGIDDSEPDEVVIIVVEPIEVAMKFTPQALNPDSKGNWVKAHFVLPAGFMVEDVDAGRPAKVEPLGIESEYINVFVNEDGLVEIEAAFGRAAFCSAATDYGPAEVTVVGLLASGQYFYGTDTIKIINKTFEYLGVLASHWLEAGCGAPDWCGGVDLDHSSMVDFVDFAMFDGCCIEVIKQ